MNEKDNIGKAATFKGDDGGSHGVYQGPNTDTPLMTGSFDECVSWCRANNYYPDEALQQWHSGKGLNYTIYRVKEITRGQ